MVTHQILILLLIGIQAVEYLAFPNWGFATVIFPLTLLARFVMHGGLIYIVPAWRNEFQNDFSTISLITWSGIKGSMSVALLLWLKEGISSKDQMLVFLPFAVVMISLVVQSSGIYPLTKLFAGKDKS